MQMQILVVGLVALTAGILIGLLIRGFLAKSNRAQSEALAAERDRQLAEVREELSLTKAESATRAGFESLAAEREKRIGQLTGEIDALRSNLAAKTGEAGSLAASVAELKAKLESEQKNLAEKLALLETAKRALADQFQALAGEILDKKSQAFSESSQAQLGTLLEPLKTQIKEFREKVEQTNVDSKVGVTELKTLIGTLGTLNQALTEEAHNLATALRRDTKMQGNWGETILRNILEKSGLQEGTHYSFQESFVETNAEGESGQRRQTDVIVKVPGGHHLIIDSKVSLNAYNDSVNAESEKERAEALKRHLNSVRNHYNELSTRNYQGLAGMESPDFVVMFVPIEPAFLLALQGDENIWHDAYKKKVLLCGPTTVLFVIRIVVDLWRQERQARNVKEVMRRGALLYDKFVGFVTDMEKVGKSIQSARDAHGEAMEKLAKADGNLIGQAEKLKRLGIRTSKSLPRNLLDASTGEDEELALTADGDDGGGSAS
jgi:DNA recombination protein RmuC